MIRYIFTLFPVILCLKTQSFIWPQHKLFSVNVCRIFRIITQQFMILFPLRLHLYCDFFSCKMLHMTIVNSKRIMTVEKVTEIDEKYLNLNVRDYNCVAVVSSQTYNSDGVMFEYTQSRHRPDHFRFYDNAIRK